MLRHRLRKLTLWTGTLLSLLIAAAFVVSASWAIMLQLGPFGVYVMSGNVMVLLDDPLRYPLAADHHDWGLRGWNSWRSDPRWVEFPIYVLFAAAALPTLLAWRFWPKPIKPGHCRCGYDLRGNTSGVCPECGVEVQA